MFSRQHTNFPASAGETIYCFLYGIKIASRFYAVTNAIRTATVLLGEGIRLFTAIMDYFPLHLLCKITPADNCKRRKKSSNAIWWKPFFQFPWNNLVGSFRPCSNHPIVSGNKVASSEGYFKTGMAECYCRSRG